MGDLQTAAATVRRYCGPVASQAQKLRLLGHLSPREPVMASLKSAIQVPPLVQEQLALRKMVFTAPHGQVAIRALPRGQVTLREAA